MTPAAEKSLVIACGALAREIVALRSANGWEHLDIECLSASLHNRPAHMPEAVRAAIRKARETHPRIFVAYGDCGTGGALDAVLAEEQVERITGAHCYEFFAGAETFATLSEAEPGTFYLTDFLARHFDRLVIEGLGLDRHPELAPLYFGNYRHLVLLTQTGEPGLVDAARRAADRLGLAFTIRRTGYGGLRTALVAFYRESAACPA